MGNTESNDAPPNFALPRQQIVTLGSVHEPLQHDPQQRPTTQNVVAVKVCTFENPRIMKAPDETYSIVGELMNAPTNVKVELYLQARLEEPKKGDFPSVVLDREAGAEAAISLQGPFNGTLTGNDVSFGAKVRLDQWPARVRAQDTARRRCPIVIRVSPKTGGDQLVPEGTGLYTFCISTDNNLVLTLRLVQGPYGPCVIHNIYGRDEEDSMCIFCWSEPRTTAVLPCHHMCLCSECAVATRMRIGAMQTCPICRQPVKDLIQINFPAREKTVAEVETPPVPSDVDPVVSESAGSASTGAVVRVEDGELPPSVTRRIAREIQAISKRQNELRRDHGVEFTFGDDFRFSTFRIFADQMSSATTLGRELRSKSVRAMEFEIMVPNGYPAEPPHVRLVSPQISAGNFFVQQHGALCLEVLSSSGWSPALTMEQVALQIKSMMADASGSISMSIFTSAYSREGAWTTAKAVESHHDNHGWGDH